MAASGSQTNLSSLKKKKIVTHLRDPATVTSNERAGLLFATRRLHGNILRGTAGGKHVRINQECTLVSFAGALAAVRNGAAFTAGGSAKAFKDACRQELFTIGPSDVKSNGGDVKDGTAPPFFRWRWTSQRTFAVFPSSA